MASTGELLGDKQGRVIRYMRVSLIDACNFRCGFCMPDGMVEQSGRKDSLTTDELLRLCRIFAGLGIHSFKITGGEPFLASDVFPVLSDLKAAKPASVTVTTNGSTLEQDAPRLAALEIDGLNVSVNAMTQDTYEHITGTRFSVRRVLDNILQARDLGLRVKINMVPLRGVNENDMLPLVEFALGHGIPVRFIELMPLGQGRSHAGLRFDEVRSVIEGRFGKAEEVFERLGNGPARYLSLAGFDARVGYIAAVSREFCSACNRIRLTRSGFLRTCLHHDHGIDLAAPLRAGEQDRDIARRIRAAVADKPDSHRFADNPDDIGLEPMFRIGG